MGGIKNENKSLHHTGTGDNANWILYGGWQSYRHPILKLPSGFLTEQRRNDHEKQTHCSGCSVLGNTGGVHRHHRRVCLHTHEHHRHFAVIPHDSPRPAGGGASYRRLSFAASLTQTAVLRSVAPRMNMEQAPLAHARRLHVAHNQSACFGFTSPHPA